MTKMQELLALYDRSTARLQAALEGCLPESVDTPAAAAAYAYWVCSRVLQHGEDWEHTCDEFVEEARRSAQADSAAERAEMHLLDEFLHHARGPLLDVGAGWGRLARAYHPGIRPVVYIEPFELGVALMRRKGLERVLRGVGEALPFQTASFTIAVVGWVLHHHHRNLDAPRLLAELRRVLAPGGRVASIEPLSDDFRFDQWIGLFEDAGFVLEQAGPFYQPPVAAGRKPETFSFLSAALP